MECDGKERKIDKEEDGGIEPASGKDKKVANSGQEEEIIFFLSKKNKEDYSKKTDDLWSEVGGR